jgi:hypothetical protein
VAFQLTSGAISRSLRRNSDRILESSWHQYDHEVTEQALRTEIKELEEHCDKVFPDVLHIFG